MNDLIDWVKGWSKSKKIMVFIFSLLLIGIFFIIEELIFPRIYLENLKETYEYNKFIDEEFELHSSLFISKKETIWNLNGYDFAKGNEAYGMPIAIGQNTLKISNGNLEKIYTFNITNNESTALFVTNDEYKIDFDYADYDGDGIPNIKENELGLATYTNDSDGDGLLDNVELIMGLNPIQKDNYDDIREYKVVQDNSVNTENYLMLNGKGNIANTFLDTAELNVGFNNEFIKSDVLSLVTSNNEKPESMTLYLKKKSSMKTEKYAIYSYNETDGEITKLQTSASGDYFYANVSNFNNFYFIGKNDDLPTGEYTNQIMLLLDNSGSLSEMEYVAQKAEKEIEKLNSGDYGNDVDFKRLSLMTSLVDRLGNEKYEYSIYAFTGDTYEVLEKSKDISAVKSGINALKNDYQNFNGTALSESIRKYASEFRKDVYGKKYMIVLTDGVDSGFATYEVNDKILNNYKKNGINIITIGLGSGVNSEYLMRLAVNTNGKYLYAADANMLETLINLIESSVENQNTKIIDGKEVTLVADSGFEVSRDGFSFSNFGSVGAGSEEGNCYGFATLSKAIYLNQFKSSAEEEKHPWGDAVSEEYSLIAYSLTPENRKRLVKGNVYNLKLNETYNTLLFSNVASRNDYRYLGEDGIPYLTDKYRKMATEAGFIPYVTDISPNLVSLTIDGEEREYSKYETIGKINLDGKFVIAENLDDYQVFQLIHRYYLIQYHHFVDMEIDSKLMKWQVDEDYDYEKEVEKMIDEIKTGSPALLSIGASVGRHSILATKVYKSNDLEQYVVGIYDSNMPGTETKIKLERQTSYKLFSETSYYSFSYDAYKNTKWVSMIYAGEY